MEKNKKITLSLSPAVVLTAVLVLGILLLLKRTAGPEKGTLSIDDTPVIVTKIQALGELTTACFYDEMVLRDSKQNSLSSSPLGSLAREGFGKDMDDHLVLIAKGTVRAGVNLLDMGPEDIRFSGDTVYLRLPAPKYLDVIVNPSDFEVFAESGRWTHAEMTDLQDSARERLLMEADHYGLKTKAYEGAMDAVAELLLASGYRLIRFDHIPSYVRMPSLED